MFDRVGRLLTAEILCKWLLTFVVVVSTTLATACGARILDKPWVWQRFRIAIRELCLRRDGTSAAVLISTHAANGPQPLISHIGLQCIAQGAASVLPAGRTFNPSRMALLEHVDALVIGEWNGRLWLRSLATPNRPMTLIGRQNDGGVGGLAVSSDQAIVLTKGPFTVYAWNVAAKAELWHRAEPKLDCIISHPREDSAVCGTSDGRLIHLDIRSGQTIRELSLYPSGFMGLCFDGQGELLASISGDGIIAVTRWRDLKPAWPEHTYQCERAASGTLAFSACSRYLVTTAKNDVYKLLLRNVSDATIAGVLSGHEGPILGACFTPGGVLYSWGCDGSIRAWNPQSRTVIGVTEVDVSSFKRSASAIKTLDARAPCFHCRANSRVIESLTAR